MRKVGGALLGLLLLSGCGFYVVPSAATPPPHATTTTVVSRLHMKVYGPRHQTVMSAIAYWNSIAGYPIMGFYGPPSAAGNDSRTATITLEDPGDGYDGMAGGNIGYGPIWIKVRPTSFTWQVVAHELGHTIGLDDYNTGGTAGINNPTYHGIMSYQHYVAPNRAHDKALVKEKA